jgi:nucleoid-associated protein YgaU
VAVASVAGLLIWAMPDGLLSTGAWRGLNPETHADQLVAAVAGVIAWALLAWLTVSSALTLIGTVPGAAGRAAAAIARRVTPTLVRRAVEAALGVAIVGTSFAPAVAHAAPRQRPAVVREASSDAALSPYDRPYDAAPPTAKPQPVPVDTVSPAGRSERDPAVVVRRGDTLWSIAAHALGGEADDAAVDAEWRRWYAANRDTIGANPDLISPGLRLQPPTPASRS